MKYEISKIFHVKEGLRLFIKDKNGFDIPFNDYNFEATAATLKASEEREFRTRLLFFYDNAEVFQHSKRSLYDFENSVFFSISKAYFISDTKAKAQIKKYTLDISGKDGWKYSYDESASSYIYEFEDVVKYFKEYFNNEKEAFSGWQHNFHLPHNSFKIQENIDYQYYINTELFPILTSEEQLNLPEEINLADARDFCDNGFTYFLDYCAQRTFDKDKLTEQHEKDIVHDILILFRELPSSHSGTSISKILRGKSKVKIQKIEYLFGKYSTIKHEQLFELADAIATYLFCNSIFKTKEDYSSGEEWRGVFEFIGSKYINKDELDICINSVK